MCLVLLLDSVERSSMGGLCVTLNVSANGEVIGCVYPSFGNNGCIVLFSLVWCWCRYLGTIASGGVSLVGRGVST